MRGGGRSAVVGEVRRAFEGGALGSLEDGDLLGRFAAGREGGAFATLVGRHGGMVWRVCRDILGDRHAAEDAFQATFLVLARKANSPGLGANLPGWLYGVARRVAGRMRGDRARRARRERGIGVERVGSGLGPEVERAEVGVLLHEEVGRLPGPYRDAIVLCYFRGLSYEAAAGRLGVSEATIRGRLARGRDRLRVRLARRGIDAPAGLLVLRPIAPMDRAMVEAATIAARGVGASPLGSIGGGWGVMDMTRRTMITLLTLATAGLAITRGPGEARPVAAAAGGDGPELARPRDTPGPPPAPVEVPGGVTVRVRAHLGPKEEGAGSGTVIASTPEASLILVAAHTVRGWPIEAAFGHPPDRISVELFGGDEGERRAGETFPAELVDVDRDSDLGLIRVGPGRVLPSARLVPDSWQPRIGLALRTSGCSLGGPPTSWATRVVRPRAILKAAEGGRIFDEIECARAPESGRFGGGLFTESGALAGACNFADPGNETGFYAAPAAIRRLLDRNGLATADPTPPDQAAPSPPALAPRDVGAGGVGGPRPVARGSVVRVRVQGHDRGKSELVLGSGTVIKSTPGESLILVAARTLHVGPGPGPDRVEVDLFDAEPPVAGAIPAEVIGVDEPGDVGLIRIRPGRILPSSPIVSGVWQPRAGQPLWAWGCSGDKGPSPKAVRFLTRSIGPSFTEGSPDREIRSLECDLMLDRDWIGGGLFTESGALAGVSSHSNLERDDTDYADPDTIRRLLDRHGLSSLHDPEPPPAPPAGAATEGTVVFLRDGKLVRTAAVYSTEADRGVVVPDVWNLGPDWQPYLVEAKGLRALPRVAVAGGSRVDLGPGFAGVATIMLVDDPGTVPGLIDRRRRDRIDAAR